MLLLTTSTGELGKYERGWVAGILRRNLNAGDIRSSAAPLDSLLSLFSFAVSDKSLAPVLPVSVSQQLCARPRLVTLKPPRPVWEERAPEQLLPGPLGTAAGTECL